jgi:amidophosphoribosyltransferase
LKIENVRSFIESSTEARLGKIKRKFAFNVADIKQLKTLILIDDSIVRGNTMRYIIGILLELNPELHIHVRIGSPPIVAGCHFGIDIEAEPDKLIYAETLHKKTTMSALLIVKSVEYLTLEQLRGVMAFYNVRGCAYCFGSGSAETASMLDW